MKDVDYYIKEYLSITSEEKLQTKFQYEYVNACLRTVSNMYHYRLSLPRLMEIMKYHDDAYDLWIGLDQDFNEGVELREDMSAVESASLLLIQNISGVQLALICNSLPVNKDVWLTGTRQKVLTGLLNVGIQ